MPTPQDTNSIHPQRILGFDLARGIALCAMLFINFKSIFCPSATAYGSVVNWIDFLERRAAVVLVMAAGAGLSLLIKKSAWQRLKSESKSEKILIKRALFLAFSGYFLSFFWSGDILHFYAVFMLAGIMVSRVSDISLFMAAVFSWLIGFFRFFDSINDFLEQPDKGLVIEHLQDTFFTGYFPFFPWFTFFIIGIWLGRQSFDNRKFKNRLMLSGLLVMVCSEMLSAITAIRTDQAGFFGALLPEQIHPVFSLSQVYLSIDLTLPTPLSVLSGIGTGLFIIASASYLSEKPGVQCCTFLTAVGRTSLSLYLFHIFFILFITTIFNIHQINNGLIVLSMVSGFLLIYILSIKWWLKLYQMGPFEILIRAFSRTSPSG